MMAEQRNIRVLMTSPSSDMGGAEKTFWFLSSRLKVDGRFEIFGAFPRGIIFPRLKRNFSRMQVLMNQEFIPRNVFRWPFYCLVFTINFILCLKEILLKKIDLVYVNTSFNLSAVWAARITGKKLAVFVLEDYFYNDPPRKARLLNFLSRSAQLIICQNKHLAENIREQGGEVRVIYAGAYEIEEKTPKPQATDHEHFTAGIIGKIHPLKGQDTFIKAIGILKREGLPVKGHIFGDYRRFSKEAIYHGKLIAYLKDNGLERDISFGRPFSLAEMYGKLDAVVIASENEGFSLVFPEALKSRKPVVSTRTGVMADVGKDGENLLFFDYGNERQLAEKLKELYHNKSLRDRLVNGGLATYKSHFEEERIARQLIGALAEVADANRD
jgi:glycosyltransferase involved in cell wall biosynthesis